MKPEEAKPTEMVDEHGKPTLWFTAKETAEIAKAYAQAVEDNRDDPCLATERPCNKWRKLFKGWSK